MDHARRRDWVFLGVFWVLLTVIGELMAFKWKLMPGMYAREAEISDDAYIYLIKLAVPVFAGVCAALLTVLVRQVDHRFGEAPPAEDGPHIKSHPWFVRGWLAVSAALCFLLVYDPGFVGLDEIRGESSADLVVQVQGAQWNWKFTYEGGEVATDELVLPVDQRVRFDLTTIDVIHSFWVPAFRMKLSNVPGRTTQLYITPTRIGDGNDDVTLRVQCNELCGAGHAAMAVPVRVVTEAEFEAWLAEHQKGA